MNKLLHFWPASVMVSTPRGERQEDLRIVKDSEYGAALQYFTGSKAHNVKLRSMAKEKGLKISEYGVFKGNKKIAGYDEKEVYQTLGLPHIAHPSGRLISKREGYEVNLDQVLTAAQSKRKALELNAYYDRLDLDEFYLKKAKEGGIKISLGTESHSLA